MTPALGSKKYKDPSKIFVVLFEKKKIEERNTPFFWVPSGKLQLTGVSSFPAV